MVKEKQFKVIMDGLWKSYAASMRIIDAMENMGCYIEPGTVDIVGVETPFSGLYGIQDAVGNTLRNLFGIQNDEFVSDLDNFLIMVYSEYPDKGMFPEDMYEQLYNLLSGYGVHVACEGDPSVYMFTGQCVDSEETVKGYLWNGSSHAYIIPYNIGIDYDDSMQRLNAHAVEVDKGTIR